MYTTHYYFTFTLYVVQCALLTRIHVLRRIKYELLLLEFGKKHKFSTQLLRYKIANTF